MNVSKDMILPNVPRWEVLIDPVSFVKDHPRYVFRSGMLWFGNSDGTSMPASSFEKVSQELSVSGGFNTALSSVASHSKWAANEGVVFPVGFHTTDVVLHKRSGVHIVVAVPSSKDRRGAFTRSLAVPFFNGDAAFVVQFYRNELSVSGLSNPERDYDALSVSAEGLELFDDSLDHKWLHDVVALTAPKVAGAYVYLTCLAANPVAVAHLAAVVDPNKADAHLIKSALALPSYDVSAELNKVRLVAAQLFDSVPPAELREACRIVLDSVDDF